MLTIHSYGPSLAIHWVKLGWKLFTKQFVRLSLLFMLLTSVMSMVAYIPLLNLLLGLFIPSLFQMILFNAAYGIRLRGYFLNQDLLQKLKNGKVWGRLVLATVLNILLMYLIFMLTYPSLPISADGIAQLSAAEMDRILAEAFTVSNLAIAFICTLIYLMVSLWIYPLICWEDLGVLKAFLTSFKISMSNALPLTLLMCICSILFMFFIFALQTILSGLPESISMVIILLVVDTLLITLYMSLFSAYMEILYGRQTQG